MTLQQTITTRFSQLRDAAAQRKGAVIAAGAVALLGGSLAAGLAIADDDRDEALAVATLAAEGPAASALLAPLEADGYLILEFERDEDGVEVEAVRDGEIWEIALDPLNGAVLTTELEDGDDNDADGDDD